MEASIMILSMNLIRFCCKLLPVGSNYTARLSSGLRTQIPQIPRKAGKIHPATQLLVRPTHPFATRIAKIAEQNEADEEVAAHTHRTHGTHARTARYTPRRMHGAHRTPRTAGTALYRTALQCTARTARHTQAAHAPHAPHRPHAPPFGASSRFCASSNFPHVLPQWLQFWLEGSTCFVAYDSRLM